MRAPRPESSPRPDPKPPLRSLLVALCAAAAVLGGLELGARAWEARRDPAHSYSAPRNPNFLRNWAPYTAPRRRPEETRLIIVIANSQGFLREQPNGNLTYAHRLQARLRRGGMDAIVANWSVPEGQGPEMVVLAARAAQHAPDLVILSAGTRPFGADVVAQAPLSYWASDVPDMAYEPAVRRRLPSEFLHRSRAFDGLSLARSASALVRLREAPRPRDEVWTWAPEPDIRRNKWQRLPLEAPNLDILRALLGEFAAALRADGAETPLLVVNMPLARRSWRGSDYPRTEEFSRQAQALHGGGPWTTVLDARDAVPDRQFTTATHMTPAGHRIYADWLLPHVLQALAPGAAPAGR